jgi:hypothetical protein
MISKSINSKKIKKGNVMYVLLIFLCAFIYWFRSNAKAAFGLDLTPFEWWLYTSLITNYAALNAWWGMRENFDVWKAGLIWQVILFAVEVSLNIYFFGSNPKMMFALGIVFVGICIGLS